MGCPSIQNMKHLLRQRLIRKCPVTVEDVNITEKIFGPDIGALKGKTIRSKPIHVKKI